MQQQEWPAGLILKKIIEMQAWRATQDMEASGLTPSQCHLLMVLYRTEGHSHTLKELESIFSVAQSTMAGTVARLEKKQLIEAFADEHDKRVKCVRLTPLGEAHCVTARRKIEENEQRLVSGLTEAEQAEFVRLLGIVYDTLYDEMIAIKGGKKG